MFFYAFKYINIRIYHQINRVLQKNNYLFPYNFYHILTLIIALVNPILKFNKLKQKT